jgi:hypothetical protein
VLDLLDLNRRRPRDRLTGAQRLPEVGSRHLDLVP